MKVFTILCLLVVSGCAVMEPRILGGRPGQEVTILYPINIYVEYTNPSKARTMAESYCGGPVRIVSTTPLQLSGDYTSDIRTTFRCLAGR